MLLLPAAAENEALGALALAARTLRSPENLARLRAAKTASELFSAMAVQQFLKGQPFCSEHRRGEVFGSAEGAMA